MLGWVMVGLGFWQYIQDKNVSSAQFAKKNLPMFDTIQKAFFPYTGSILDFYLCWISFKKKLRPQTHSASRFSLLDVWRVTDNSFGVNRKQ